MAIIPPVQHNTGQETEKVGDAVSEGGESAGNEALAPFEENGDDDGEEDGRDLPAAAFETDQSEYGHDDISQEVADLVNMVDRQGLGVAGDEGEDGNE